MRFYSFTNANYMSQIQLGIQTAHCIADMSQKYKNCEKNSSSYRREQMFDEWAELHKTIIILNGGNCEDLENLVDFVDNPENPYPTDWFYEDRASLNNAITCVGIILPDFFYETMGAFRTGLIKETQPGVFELSPFAGEELRLNVDFLNQTCSEFQLELMRRVMNYRLA